MRITKIAALDEIINQGTDAFKRVIDNNSRLTEAELYVNGEKLTLLDYLICKHQTDVDTLDMIKYLLNSGVSLRKNQPLHRALRLGKLSIASELMKYNQHIEETPEQNLKPESSGFTHMFKQVARTVKTSTIQAFESMLKISIRINSRDLFGKTILSYGIACGDKDIFDMIMALKPDTDATIIWKGDDAGSVAIHPIHLAILENNQYAYAQLLNLNNYQNRCLSEEYTPLLLIAQQVNQDLIEYHLNFLTDKGKSLDEQDAHGNTAVDLLIKHIQTDFKKADAIMCIARLIAYGVELTDAQTVALQPYRQQLLSDSNTYLQSHPHLAKPFMDRFHDQTNNLHCLFHVVDSWWQIILSVFGWQSHTAFELEALVTHCVNNKSPEAECPFSLDDQKFAMFCKLYNNEFNQTSIFKHFDPVRKMLVSGEMTSWSQVLAYAGNHIDSRADKIVRHVSAVVHAQPIQPKPVTLPKSETMTETEDYKSQMAILQHM